jgi:carboxyl-terminal processing protease
VTITRETIDTPVVASSMHTVNGTKIGVVALSMFSEGAHGEVRQAIDKLRREGAKGLVLDLRGNGGGLVSEARMVASLFLRSGVIVTTKGRNQPTTVLRASCHPLAPSLPMVVLVDRQTASAAEIVTGALQDHRRASVVGTHTYGKGVFQELAPLQGGGGIKLTVGHYFTPNGRNLGGGGVSQGAGIAPEVPVRGGVDGGHGLDEAFSVLAARVRAAR